MTPNLVTPRGNHDAPAGPEIEEQVMSLYQGMLSYLRRSRETPLQFEIDSQGIVTAVLEAFPPGGLPGRGAASQEGWATLKAALDSLTERFLQDEPAGGAIGNDEPGPSAPGFNRAGHDEGGSSDALHNRLAAWLERYYHLMREASPQAIDIAALRAEGYQDRDIAERLGLGLRLVTRVVREMRANWEAAAGKE